MTRRISALRDAGRERVAVDLDGEPWRIVPLTAALEAGLSVGAELDRERARSLVRALRRSAALDSTLRALRARDRSRRELDERLERRGVRRADRAAALETVERAGLVDDVRFAERRAAMLAARGNGDALIFADLERHGIAPCAARAALEAVPGEAERVAEVVAARGESARTLRFLAARGFGEDALDALVAKVTEGAVG